MFQFAFAASKAKDHHSTPFIDDWGRLKYFEAYRKYKRVNFRNRLYLSYLLIKRKINIIPLEKFHGFEPNLLHAYTNNFLHIGYFQSSLYFSSNSSHIHSLYQVRKKYRIELPQEPYLAIHLRFGDYENLQQKGLNQNAVLSKDYFRQAFSRVKLKYSKIIAVSDEPDRIRETLGIYEVEIYSGSEIQDFQILKNADSLIISNSTFSWWAAYLNSSCKQVIAPKQWLGTKENVYPRDIFAGLTWDLI